MTTRGMSNISRALAISLILLAVSGLNLADANSSGKTGAATGSGCFCHNTDAMIMPTMNGNPSSYTPGATYSLSWSGSGLPASGQGGFNLVASAGSWSNLGGLVKQVSGELTHSSDGQRSWTADWTAPAVGTGDVTFDLAVLYANGNNQNTNDNWGTNSWTSTEGAAPPSNTPPVASNVMISPDGDVEVDQSLTVSYTYSDDDGDSEGTTQIRWLVNNVVRSSFNDATTIPASSTSVGETWIVKVTPHDGNEFGNTVQGVDSADIVDIDSDGDGTLDGNDAFPNDASEDTDSDGDGVGDNADAFPNDASETLDTDMDGVGDNADAFPNDASETLDSDMDGVGDNADAFPSDASETLDSDMDGVGDNGDAFPNDASETLDSDMDGVGDNADAFPNDASEDTDSDMDSVGDNADAFPNDPSEDTDSDMDSVGDNADAFPNDSSETMDSDMDGVGDNSDAFPNDANEDTDSDMDGVGDNADAFPTDASETIDSDMDGVGDNSDAFPTDASETMDSDMDGVGDNSDALPNDASETMDTDMDGVGDNSDVFPEDSNESKDSDSDGVGDNADAFPNDDTETLDTDGDGVGDNAQLAAELAAAEDEDDDSNMMLIIGIIAVVIAIAVGGIMFMRKGDGGIAAEVSKDFSEQLMPGQFKSFQPTHTEAKPVSHPQPIATAAVVAEPAVVQQWTDESGNTWRTMDNGTTLWWNGTDWQQA